MLIINFKNYPELSFTNAVNVLNEILKEELNLENIFFAPAINDIGLLKNIFPTLNFVSQNLENSKSGSTTGHISYEILKNIGIEYTLLNHSENRLGVDSSSAIKSTIELIEVFKAEGIKTIACCESIEEAIQLNNAQPYAIAFEPKELIGSGVSVTTKPEAVAEFIKSISANTLKFIGAGVSTGEDITNGKNLGANGFLLASAFAKAENKVEKLYEFIHSL